jgi:hypothetical protein
MLVRTCISACNVKCQQKPLCCFRAAKEEQSEIEFALFLHIDLSYEQAKDAEHVRVQIHYVFQMQPNAE